MAIEPVRLHWSTRPLERCVEARPTSGRVFRGEPSTRSQNIESQLQESRVFEPPAEFAAAAHVKSRDEYEQIRRAAAADPEAYWAEAARQLHWFRPWHTVLDWKPPFAKWFDGATTNISYNCLDRHLAGARRTKTAILWE